MNRITLFLLPLAACGGLSSMLGGKHAGSTSLASSSAPTTTSAEPTRSSPPPTMASRTEAPHEAPFADQDEGPVGPLQTGHDGEVVFANAPIKRDSGDASVLVTQTRLARPLFVRAYLPKTPAAIFHANGLSCSADDRRIFFFAKVEGSAHKDPYELMEMESDKFFPVTRSQTITDPDGNDIASIVPTKPFALDADAAPELFEFAQLASELQPGANIVDVELHVGCNAHGKYGRQTLVAAKGRIRFDVGQGDVAKLARLIKVRPGDAGATARLKSLYTNLLVPGAKLLAFAADPTTIEAQEKKETTLRVIMRNADKTCSYRVGRWVEPYAGAGRYETGSFEAVTSTTYPLPCP